MKPPDADTFSTAITGETQPIRPGEEIDKERLAEYLRSHGLLTGDELQITQFAAGSSNLTYLIKARGWDCVLRRPPFGNQVKSAHDMRREFDVLSKLSKVYYAAPAPLLFCDDTDVIGAEFYLIERRSGLIIRGEAPAAIESSHDMQIAITRSFILGLSDLHKLDLRSSGLDDFGKPEGYCRRQVEGWTRRYLAARTHDHPELEFAIEWLNDRIPNESGAALVHNDYKFDNVMFDPHNLVNITAVLDWEMATVGDPLMDLGTTLAYWRSPDDNFDAMRMPFNPYVLMENITRRQLADMYAEASGREIQDILYYYVFGTFKIAAICQQIYARWAKGHTRDERFRNFDKIVKLLGRSAERAIAVERI
jgi:aminoglycoside phosphotransferase (APT) family kinase protein